jgi:hypothetical protein
VSAVSAPYGEAEGKEIEARGKVVGPVAKPKSNVVVPGLAKPKKPKPPKPIKQIGPALALSGGAAHGDFEVGVVRYLYDKGLVPKIICGTSVGSINALKLAEGEPKGAATADSDGHIQGLSGLIAIWKALKVDNDMYTQGCPRRGSADGGGRRRGEPRPGQRRALPCRP